MSLGYRETSRLGAEVRDWERGPFPRGTLLGLVLFLGPPNFKPVDSGGVVSKREQAISGRQSMGREDEAGMGAHWEAVCRQVVAFCNVRAERFLWRLSVGIKHKGDREKGLLGVPQLMAVGQGKGRRSKSHLHEQTDGHRHTWPLWVWVLPRASRDNPPVQFLNLISQGATQIPTSPIGI